MAALFKLQVKVRLKIAARVRHIALNSKYRWRQNV